MDYNNYDLEDFVTDEFFQKYATEESEDAKQFWKEWINTHPEKSEMVKEAKRIVNTLGLRLSETERLEERNKIEKLISGETLQIQPASKQVWLSFNKAAAIIVFAIAAFLGYWLSYKKEETAPIKQIAFIEKYINNGQKLTLTFHDGTIVKLNSGTKIKYPENFDATVREIWLEGEAFFDVTKHPDWPFIVHTQNLDTRVLGTSFNVKAFPNEDHENISLVSGKVKVNNKVKTESADSVFLTPGEGASFDEFNHSLQKGKFNPNTVLAWKNGILQFEGASFKEIVPVLERWYGVNFQIQTKQPVKGKFTGKFSNQSLDIVLQVLGETSEFNYQINKKEVIIN